MHEQVITIHTHTHKQMAYQESYCLPPGSDDEKVLCNNISTDLQLYGKKKIQEFLRLDIIVIWWDGPYANPLFHTSSARICMEYLV